MKIESVKKNLIKNISIAEKISSVNLSLPVLSCILLIADKKLLTIKATDLDLGVEIKIPAKIEEEGIIAVPANILNNTISNIYDSNITFETKNDNLVISTSKSRSLIKSQQHSDFPNIPIFKEKQSFKIKTLDFLNGIKSVWYSASLSSIKQELSSIYIQSKGGNIIFTATDSFRLAEKKIFISKDFNEFDPILIPFRNIQNIIYVFDDTKGYVDILLNDNQISFVFDNIYLTSRLINGTFPDYTQIIPKEYSTEVVVLKNDIINSLKKINIFSNKFNQVSFSIKPSKKSLTISSENSDVGETTENIDAAITGDNLDINFNFKYINDCFQSINSDSVTLSFSGVGKPLVIRGISDKSFLYLVMPMNK